MSERDNKSVFDRLDAQEEKLGLILDALKKTNNNNTTVNTNKSENQSVFNEFLRKSFKENIWFGEREDFIKQKKRVTLIGVIFIILAIISTILTSIAVGTYSTFSLFQNAWVIASIVTTIRTSEIEKRTSNQEISNKSYEEWKFIPNAIWVNSYKEKKRYKWTRILSYIAIVCNIIAITVLSKSPVMVLAIIFEIIVFALSIVFTYFRNSFYSFFNLLILGNTSVYVISSLIPSAP